MSYQVLARKYRPSNFAELEGQEHVRQALENALEQNRLHHAYLFTGTRGTGKTTIARILAKCLNCETGITSTPCGVCSSCQEIAQGRSVDLIEVDAASRTRVDETRELLDNVQYMPTHNRFKIYLIDEVHMFSNHSFNALLKTLEEPPEHVKFLLATTDPKKLPITVLSRCLQFNLKNLSPERVVRHLALILEKENIPFEENALWQLGRAADGSMRDALSLTDQAISFGNQKVLDAEVRSMLGAIDQLEIYELLQGLIERDAARVLDKVRRMSEFAPDYQGLLADLLSLLHRVAVAQAVPEGIDNSQGDREQVLGLAQALGREEVQLYYQIGLIGQRDLPLAPDARSGFEMVLLRMLSFVPNAERTASARDVSGVADSGPPATPPAGGADTVKKPESVPATSPGHEPPSAALTVAKSGAPAQTAAEPVQAPAPGAQSTALNNKGGISQPAQQTENPRPMDISQSGPARELKAPAATPTGPVPGAPFSPQAEFWADIVTRAGMSGVTQSIAANCELKHREGQRWQLCLRESHGSIWNDTHRNRMARAISDLLGESIKVDVEIGAVRGETPDDIERRRRSDRLAVAIATLESDEKLGQLLQHFGGTLRR
ncbi:MAG: DNA polymerase III subunit gamma/tau, partial [Pseudomonadales bacterium]|nr:DNA polymerase III subunit gamma/tau [Pseudomonadales bacterium]